MVDKKVMETLRKNIGKKLTVRYVWYGRVNIDREVLEQVTDFVNIVTEHSGIPFIGYGCAIQTISDEDGVILYCNPLISNSDDLRTDKEIEAMIALSFGKKIATKCRRKREKIDRKWKAQKAQLNKKAKAKTAGFIKEGESLVKSELKNKWRKYVSNNTKDFYSASIIEASLRIMQALSKGIPFKKAEATIDDLGITIFQMGLVAQTISYFYSEGEKFRRYWNRQYLPEKEAKDVKGVVNPAVISVKLK